MANLLVSQRKIEPESSKCTLLDNVREAISTVQKRFSGNDMQVSLLTWLHFVQNFHLLLNV